MSQKYEKLDPEELSLMKDNKCPDCRESQWLEGPSGGMNVNIMCGHCGSRFNIGPVPEWTERISEPSPGVVVW